MHEPGQERLLAMIHLISAAACRRAQEQLTQVMIKSCHVMTADQMAEISQAHEDLGQEEIIYLHEYTIAMGVEENEGFDMVLSPG